MPFTNAEIYDIKNPNNAVPSAKKTVIIEIARVAKAVLSEPASTPYHEARVRWAKQAVVTPEVECEKMLILIMLDDRIQAKSNLTAITAAEINSVVADLVNAVAL
jgi:hypothetical protein